MADLATNSHASDNPFNLAQLLNSALQTGVQTVAARVIPTSAAARPVVGATPGTPDATPTDQLGEAGATKPDPVKKYGPLALGAAAVAGIFWLNNR